MNTCAIVITYKNPEMLARCMDSLRGQCETLIVDNSEHNRLYTEAINDGIRTLLTPVWVDSPAAYLQGVRGHLDPPDHILICCDDVIVRPGTVAALEKCLDENPKAAIAMPLQVGTGGKVNCGGCIAAWPVGTHISEPLGSPLYANGPYETYWANGACFLLRASAVRECGLLDENMRFICSDSDYSFTLRSRGWKILVAPDAHVEHEARGALQTDNAWLERIKQEDMLFFMRKWMTGGLFQELSAEGRSLRPADIQSRLHYLTQAIALTPKG